MNDNTSESPVRDRPADTRHHRPDGPHLAAVAIVHGVLLIGGLVAGAAMASGRLPPSPLGSGGDVTEYLRHHTDAVQVMALLQFGAAVPLLIYAATGYARQLRLGLRAPGPVISLVGGVWATAFAALSACLLWTVGTVGADGSADLIHALALAAFVIGGVGFATGAGLLIAGLAVPALILRFVPRWFAVAGLVIAACGELSFLSMVAEPLVFLIPIVRFGAIPWLIAMGFLLPRRRAPRNARPPRTPGGEPIAAGSGRPAPRG